MVGGSIRISVLTCTFLSMPRHRFMREHKFTTSQLQSRVGQHSSVAMMGWYFVLEVWIDTASHTQHDINYAGGWICRRWVGR